MKHGRDDYNRIQDPEGKIGADEPVFLLRAKDRNAPAVVRQWATLTYRGASTEAQKEAGRQAIEQAERMEAWQKENGSQVADLDEARQAGGER